jgi:hypothetical protein
MALHYTRSQQQATKQFFAKIVKKKRRRFRLLALLRAKRTYRDALSSIHRAPTINKQKAEFRLYATNKHVSRETTKNGSKNLEIFDLWQNVGQTIVIIVRVQNTSEKANNICM